VKDPVQERREQVLDALSPPGTDGWYRAQLRRHSYKPGWRFELLSPDQVDPSSPLFTPPGYMVDWMVLRVEVRDPNRFLHRMRFPAMNGYTDPEPEERHYLSQTIPPHKSLTDRLGLIIRLPIFNRDRVTAEEFRRWLLSAIQDMEVQLSRMWLMYDGQLVYPDKER
jgi:hypothetical protein